MKKVFFAIVALSAMMFQSCGNSAKGGQENDSTAVETSVEEEPVVADAQEAVSLIEAAVESNNPEDLKAQVEKSVAYLKKLIEEGKAEQAEKYSELLKQFLENNKEKVETVSSDYNALEELVKSVSELPEKADKAVEAAGEQAEDAANEMKEAAEKKVNEEAQKAQDAAKEEAGKAVDNAANAIKGKLGL